MTPLDRVQPKIAVFTHDTYGLGHVRRSLHILGALSRRLPDASLLLITGSPLREPLRGLPPNADYVKIPTVVKTGSPQSQPPHLTLSVNEVTRLRGHIVRETVLGFSPDVFLVDNFPLGSLRELLPTLCELRGLPTRTVLGLRDILDEPAVIRSDWRRQEIYEVLDLYYDKILVYGMPEILDIIEAYSLPQRIAQKVRYCGYLTWNEPFDTRTDHFRQEFGGTGPLVLATGGGGGDAFPMLSLFLETLQELPRISSLVFSGPLMREADRAELHRKARAVSNVILKDFVPDLRAYLATADLVVSMCGYNTAAEIAVQRPRAIVIPRTWRYGEHASRAGSGSEGEQIMRARALERLGVVRVLELEGLKAKDFALAIESALAEPRPSAHHSINVEGLAAISHR